MADVLAYLEAVVGADISDFRRNMAEVRGTLTETAGLGGSLQSLGSALTLGLTVPIALLGAASVKVFSDLDSAMRNVNSIMQLPEAQFEKLNQQVIQFGENTRNGTTAAAQALYAIVSAGFGVNDTAQAMQLLAVASKTAEAGLADESSTAQLLAQSLLAYSAGSEQAQHFADVLTETVNLGVGSMNDFQSAFANTISTAALMKVQFGDLGGTLAFLTQRGMSASEAGTSLNQILTQMLKPTQGITDAYTKLGVASGTELISKFGGLEGALKALIGTTDGSAASLAQMFTNVRALRGIADIANDLGAYNGLLVNFGDNVNGITDKAQQQQILSFSSQIDYMKSALQGLADVIGQKLAPMLAPIISGIKDFALTLANANPDVVQTAINIGLVGAALGPVIWLVGALMSPLGLLATGIVLVAKAWNDNFLGIRDAVTKALPAIDKALNDVHLAVVSFAVSVAQDWYNIKSAFSAIFGDDFTKLIQDIFGGRWDEVVNDLGKIATKIYNLFEGYIVKPITDFTTGTIIPDFKKAIGNMLSGVDPEVFVKIAVGIGAIGSAILLFTASTFIANFPVYFLMLTNAVSGLGGALTVAGIATKLNGIADGLNAIYANPILGFILPLIPVVLVIAGAFYDLQNNVGGFADQIERLSKDITQGNFLQAFQDLTNTLATLFGGEMRQDQQAFNNAIQNSSGNSPVTPPGLSFGATGTGSGNNITGGLKLPSSYYGSSIGLPPPSNGYKTQGAVSGAVYTSYQTNQINITTNNAQEVIDNLRARGIDLQKRS